MPITTKQAPPAAAEALRTGLAHIAGDAEMAALRRVPPSATAGAVLPHRTYHLGLDAVLERRGIAAAQFVGWRYFLGGQNAPFSVAAEVQARGTDDFEFAATNRGPFVRQMAEVIERIEPQLDAAEYEPRLLRIPAIYVAAVWLSARGDDDLFVPMAPSHRALEAGRIYGRPEFEEAIGRAADEMAVARQTGPSDEPSAP